MQSPEELVALVKGRNSDEVLSVFAGQGGLEGLLDRLDSDRERGIHAASTEARRERFGANQVSKLDQPSYLRLLLEACSDLTIMILAGAAVISLFIAVAYERTMTSYAEAIAILVSIAVVTNVAAINDWNKQRHFARLFAEASRVVVRVVRDGEKTEIDAIEVVVGDQVLLTVGEIVCADGILLKGDHVSVDESALTGEPKLVRKEVVGDAFILSGTKVMEGEGRFVVLAVGEKSEAGEIQKLVQKEEGGKSVLTAKLDRVVILIGKLGLGVAILCFLVMAMRFVIFRFFVKDEDGVCVRMSQIARCIQQSAFPPCVGNASGPCCVDTQQGVSIVGTPCAWDKSHLGEILNFFITAVTILVVAVPEGLPLAVTLALAFAGRRMQKEQNLVKHLDACETMGSATTICSDKTGTLTKNRMTVVRAEIPGADGQAVPDAVAESLVEGISLNSSADIRWNAEARLYDQIGNKTECALLGFVQGQLKLDYNQVRAEKAVTVLKTLPFSSDKKYSAVLVACEGGKFHVHVKGASEVLLECCVSEMNATGEPIEISILRRAALQLTIKEMAQQAMRTIVVAMKVAADERLEDSDISGLSLLGVFGIEDPLRDEVPAAIMKCRRAGIDVRMVTGDNIDTAVAIARNCHILRPQDLDADRTTPLPNRALTGPEFRRRVLGADGEVNQAAFDEIWPHMRVLARSSPADKYTLVTGLMNSELYQTELGQKLGLYPDRQVVAVTGDGTNDAPALKKADVGLAMGITGTQVAKDAADIILLDDNFTSIVNACKWGRNVYDAIAKFLQFQLTVNVVAISLAIVGSIAYSESPLRAVQMLWVNLIMDSIASLALATEPPTEALLNRPPYGRNRSIVSLAMVWNVVGHSVYQLTVLLVLFFAGPGIFGFPDGRDRHHKAPPTEHYTLIFNCFVFMQLGNQVNSRKLYHEYNMFEGILANKLFVLIELLEVALQVIVVEFGGVWFRTKPLPSRLWLLSLATGFGSFLVQLAIVAVARASTSLTTKPWLSTNKATGEPQAVSALTHMMSSKILSGIISVPDEDELRRSSGQSAGFRRNPTRELRASRLYKL